MPGHVLSHQAPTPTERVRVTERKEDLSRPGNESVWRRKKMVKISCFLGRGLATQATLKKSLFPVQRVAIIVASREAAKSFFSFFFFPLYRNGRKKCWKKKKNREI